MRNIKGKKLILVEKKQFTYLYMYKYRKHSFWYHEDFCSYGRFLTEIFFVDKHSMNIKTKFGFNWTNGFREED